MIDFIDMDERKNNSAVEKRFKDKLKTDRARIQVGRISGFGLLEMSRQRLRPGMLEATTQMCPHCHGTGLLRSDDNVSLAILRSLEEEGVRGKSKEVLVRAPVTIANFLMNGKREHIADIEARYGLSVRIECDPSLTSPDYAIEKFKTATRHVPEPPAAVVSGSIELMEEDVEEAVEAAEALILMQKIGQSAAVAVAAAGKWGQQRRKPAANGEGADTDAAPEQAEAAPAGQPNLRRMMHLSQRVRKLKRSQSAAVAAAKIR